MTMRIETYDSNGNLLFVEDGRDLDDVKRQKWDQINVHREVLLNQGLWYMGHFWDTSARARSNVTGVLTGVTAGIPLPDGFVWRDNNNNNVAFDATNLVTLGAYMIAYVNQVYEASWGLKNTVDSYTTLEELDAFLVEDQAWPDGNMDGTKPS